MTQFDSTLHPEAGIPVALERPEALSPVGQATLRDLMQSWFAFERRLGKVPIIRRLEEGTFTRQDYLQLLRNLRPQVIEGSRWIARCASSFDRDHATLRSVVLGHAGEEHRDYEVLERDYCAAGGELDDIRSSPQNLGTEAFHAYMMHTASGPNPIELLGAMWIIEGLGDKMAHSWAERICELTGLDERATAFLRYHAHHDDDHLGKLYAMLELMATTEARGERIARCSRVVARLYALQLEELDHV
jgi:3-oxoacyl-[acyl-carrier-protein] synthase-3